ncbi:MAG TPA: hypothetical protein PLS66_01535 [Tepiditoga sp.]|nr:hypothetical protein [Thermotogota bacterium]HOO73950.1 hypothetical protein [Tepiditoga sp.]
MKNINIEDKKELIEKKIETKINTSERLNNHNFVSKSIYGTILIYATIISQENAGNSFIRILMTIIFTTLIILIADFYSKIMAALFVKKRKLKVSEIFHIIKDILPIAVGSQIPTGVFLFGQLFNLSGFYVFLATKIAGIFALFLYGYLTGLSLYEKNKIKSVKLGFINAVIGYGIILLKALIH